MLTELFAGAIEDARGRQELVSIKQLEKLVATSAPALNAIESLSPRDFIHVIAEIKRASPSKGIIAEIPEAAALAVEYELAGASAISVLTEERRFLGSLADLEAVRAVTKIPLIRKDFISDEYQCLEARAFGADIVLLIVAGLEKSQIQRLKLFIEDLGMTALVETHNRDEVEIALDLGTKLIGINARDLSTFETNANLFGELVSQIGPEVIKVAESAVVDVEDVIRYRAAGADAVLVGEALVRGNPSTLIASFLQPPRA